ncbi:MAG: BON domain-containing protein, partial [Noviherbaspirillum sp.]
MEQEAARSHTLLKWLGGVAIGAAAMYLADPDRGKRRRALAKDRMQSLMVRTSGAIDVASRDFGNRVQGLRARATDIVSQRKKRGTVDDAIVAARVRTRIGRVVTHPHAIKLMVYQGRAMLNGPVLAQEKDQLLDAVLAVPGVTSIEDNLQVHDHPEHIASLQGSGRSRQTQAAIMRENWPPALRAMATLGGGALGIYGLTRRTPVSALLAMLGLGMLARSISNQPLMRGAGSWSGKSAIELHKTIHIAASPETVFDFWSKYENFPHFMSHVREARDLGGGRSHWIV